MAHSVDSSTKDLFAGGGLDNKDDDGLEDDIIVLFCFVSEKYCISKASHEWVNAKQRIYFS